MYFFLCNQENALTTGIRSICEYDWRRSRVVKATRLCCRTTSKGQGIEPELHHSTTGQLTLPTRQQIFTFFESEKEREVGSRFHLLCFRYIGPLIPLPLLLLAIGNLYLLTMRCYTSKLFPADFFRRETVLGSLKPKAPWELKGS